MAARVVLVGAGNMGGALLRGWLDAGHGADRITVLDPGAGEAIASLCDDHGVAVCAQPHGVAPPDVLMVAVKPQMMGQVLPGLKGLVGEETVAVSVAAGTTVKTLGDALFGNDARVVRAMPNTPALVRRGITGCYATPAVTGAQRDAVTALMEAVGEVVWLDEEAQIDAVTGVSGSGPAYVFHLVEALAAAARARGLSEDTAIRLARATVSGAGALLANSPDDAATLRRNVTSPGGTTAAGLAVLMADDALTDLMKRTVAAAAERAEELSKG